MINPLTPEQLAIARHALGLPNKTTCSYRNRYFATPGGDKHRILEEMVEAGFARRSMLRSGANLHEFWLTRAGADRALLSGETLCREDFPLIGQD